MVHLFFPVFILPFGNHLLESEGGVGGGGDVPNPTRGRRTRGSSDCSRGFEYGPYRKGEEGSPVLPIDKKVVERGLDTTKSVGDIDGGTLFPSLSGRETRSRCRRRCI